MRSATRVTVSTFGVLASIAGVEHGIGEMLQGNIAPDGMVFLSWPDAAFFHVVSGEPAMSVIPNLLASGALSILFSLVFLVWVTLFIHRKNAALVLLLLSIAMLLVGAGFGPPLLGVILSFAATRIRAPRAERRARPRPGLQALLARLWLWSLGAGLLAWLMLFPGLNLLYVTFGVDSAALTTGVIAAAFGLLLLTITAAFAHDTQQRQMYVRRRFA